MLAEGTARGRDEVRSQEEMAGGEGKRAGENRFDVNQMRDAPDRLTPFSAGVKYRSGIMAILATQGFVKADKSKPLRACRSWPRADLKVWITGHDRGSRLSMPRRHAAVPVASTPHAWLPTFKCDGGACSAVMPQR